MKRFNHSKEGISENRIENRVAVKNRVESNRNSK